MPKDERRFVIVPREVLTDPAYAAVRADRCALGSWLLLFLEADIVWPVSPALPRWLGDAELELLTGAGLMALDGEERYRLAIVDSARSAAKAKAEAAAAARWGEQPDAPSIAPSNAPGIAPSNPTSNGQGTPPSNARGHARPMPTQTQTTDEDSDVLDGRVGRSARRAGGKGAGLRPLIERPDA